MPPLTSYFPQCPEWQKARRYLNVHPVLPDALKEKDPSFEEKYFSLSNPLQLNSALVALKLAPSLPPVPAKQHLELAEKETSSVLRRLRAHSHTVSAEALAAAPTQLKADVAKAYYRRALARVQMRRDEEAEEDLSEAIKFAPEDAGIKKEKAAVSQRRAEKVKKQRAAYSRMFGSSAGAAGASA